VQNETTVFDGTVPSVVAPKVSYDNVELLA
jgi:hypothetical protein